MSKTKLYPLKCLRSNGRWNKGDVASFEKDRAEALVKSKIWEETELPAASEGVDEPANADKK